MASYMEREGEKTLGELQRDIDSVKKATIEERKAQLVLELVIEKRKQCVRRMMKLFAFEAEAEEQRKEIIDILDHRPENVLLDPQVPCRPIVWALGTGRLANMLSLNVSNNSYTDDAVAITLGHILGASPHATLLESVVIGGTAVRCRGLSAIISGAVRRRQRLPFAKFVLHALNTEMYEDPPEAQEALRQLAKSASADSNITIVL